MPSISVITSTWNSEPFIDQCIASVQSQKHADIEHVFVDGGSTDGTLEKIRALSGNVRWVTDVRGGISNAMNVGAKMATGDVIAHLHGDDYYCHDSVLSIVSEELRLSQSPWLFGRILSDVSGNLVKPNWKMPKYSYGRLLRGNFIAHPATFVDRQLFLDAGGFDESLKYAMDYDLWLRLAAKHMPAYVDDYLAVFRRHEGSTSTANFEKAFREDHAVRSRYISGLTSRSFHNAIYHWRLWRHQQLRHAAANS